MKISKKKIKSSFIVYFALIAIQSVYCQPSINTSTQSLAISTVDTVNPTTKIETVSIETKTITPPISNGGASSGTTTRSLSSRFIL